MDAEAATWGAKDRGLEAMGGNLGTEQPASLRSWGKPTGQAVQEVERVEAGHGRSRKRGGHVRAGWERTPLPAPWEPQGQSGLSDGKEGRGGQTLRATPLPKPALPPAVPPPSLNVIFTQAQPLPLLQKQRESFWGHKESHPAICPRPLSTSCVPALLMWF